MRNPSSDGLGEGGSWGKKASHAILAQRYPWNEGVITQKPMMLVLNGCQPAASVSAGPSPTILQPPPWTLPLPDAVKGMRHLPARAENPKPCSEKALTGLVTVNQLHTDHSAVGHGHVNGRESSLYVADTAREGMGGFCGLR